MLMTETSGWLYDHLESKTHENLAHKSHGQGSMQSSQNTGYCRCRQKVRPGLMPMARREAVPNGGRPDINFQEYAKGQRGRGYRV